MNASRLGIILVASFVQRNNILAKRKMARNRLELFRKNTRRLRIDYVGLAYSRQNPRSCPLVTKRNEVRRVRRSLRLAPIHV